MKSFLPLVLLLLRFCPSYCQSDSANASSQNYTLSIDTLKVQMIVPRSTKPWYENSALPWIASLCIAIITVGVNIFISRSARRTSLKIAESQFQATLNSNNRQDWINKVRDCISELMTHCKNLNTEFHEKVPNENNRRILQEKVSYQNFKLKLLLSTNQPVHQELLAAVGEIMNILDFHFNMTPELSSDFNQNPEFFQLSEKIIDKGRELLYWEWQKIQNHQFKS